ncbi:MAG: radical SAM family heme chaperone HemW [Planctomycetota bacterium]
MKHPQQAITPPFRSGFSPETRVDALYLHLPFCFHKCHYCDFYSVVEQPGHDRQAAFTDALIAELHQWAEHLDKLAPRTIFAGGGTPTYLRPELWGQLLQAMDNLGLLEHCEEFTVEANPETVTPELMQQLADGGVNRVSIGAQSFQRESLQALERWHDPDNVPRAAEACRAAGIGNFSLDLIFAIPGQTLSMLDDDLSRLVAIQPKHLSTYGLTYEPNTALTARLRVGKVTPIDEDTQREMYQHVLDRLEAEGFEHYEVSNWAKKPESDTGFRCLHNLTYWQNRNWLGLGPAAASHLDGQRWRNTPNLATYLASSPDAETQDHDQLPGHERVGERLMLGLRLSDGLSLDWIESHLPTDDRRRSAIQEMIDIDMLERTETHLRLTRRGLFVADSVIAKLL